VLRCDDRLRWKVDRRERELAREGEKKVDVFSRLTSKKVLRKFSAIVQRILQKHLRHSLPKANTHQARTYAAGTNGDVMAYDPSVHASVGAFVDHFVSSVSVRCEGSTYQCLICGRKARDRFNQRRDALRHLLQGDSAAAAAVEAKTREMTFKGVNGVHTCLTCKKVFSKFKDAVWHCMHKHTAKM